MTKNNIDDLLTGAEPENSTNHNMEFKPIFNVREEFVLWIREQFPKLKTYAKKKQIYEPLETRKDEVYQAALGAVNHGALSTEACASAKLRSGWDDFEDGFGKKGDPNKRAKSLESFVRSLEELSISLGGDKHYTDAGHFLSGRSYGNFTGNLKAFVYRIGDRTDKDASYLSFDKRQEFEDENKPELIGELTRLTKWDVEQLEKFVKKFKGSEELFIQNVDRLIPEEGQYAGYSGSMYGAGSIYGSGSIYGGYSESAPTTKSYHYRGFSDGFTGE